VATADEIARTESPQFDFELKFFVSGKRDFLNRDAIEAGQPYTPTVETDLTANVDKNDTSIPVTSTSGFTTGVICIAPNGDDEQYEIVYYGSMTSTTFDDLTRYPGGDDPDHFSGFHTDGAVVSEWLDITDLVTGSVTFSQEYSDGIGLWSASLQGVSFNSRLLARDNAVLCMWRFRPKDGDLDDWTDWTVAFLGYFKTVNASETYKREKSWRAAVEGVSQYLVNTDAPPSHSGKVDVAAGKSVTVSSVLPDPWLEHDSGEYQGYPSLDGANLVDGDLTTLWISQNVPQVSRPTTHSNCLQINEIMLEQHTGLPALQWIELFYKHPDGETSIDLKHYSIVNQVTHWERVEYDGEVSSIPNNNFVNQFGKGREMDAGGSWAVFVSDRAEFERRWQLLGGHILDWREKTVGSFSLSKTGGFVALMFLGNSLEPIVWYGAVAPQKFGEVTDFEGHGPNWSGLPVPLPDPGHSMARSAPGLVTTPSANAFVDPDEMNPTPGGFNRGDEEWASVDLGALDRKLEEELSSGETGYMVVDDLLGFLESGDVMIDAEVIGYAERQEVGGEYRLVTLTRGKYSTTPATHPEDSTVIPYEGGVALNCHLVGSLRWRRRPVMSGTSYVAPRVFDWLVSSEDSVIYPDNALWDDPLNGWPAYWTRYHFSFIWPDDPVTILEHTTDIEPQRVRHAMLVIHEMTDDGRAKMNEINVYAQTFELDDGSGSPGLVDGALSGYVIKYLLCHHFGLDEDLFTMTCEGGVFSQLDTTRARYLEVFRDILRRTGCALLFGFDERVEHRFDPLYPLRTLPDVEITWDEENTRSVELSMPDKHNVSQVILRANDDTEEGLSYEVRYPAEPIAIGSELALEAMCLGSITDALLMAEQVFRRRNGPLQATIIPVGPAEWARVGQRHLLDWVLDTEGAMIADRNFVVTQVQFVIDLGNAAEGRDKGWTTSIGLEEMVF
jgi:hypothetical protein